MYLPDYFGIDQETQKIAKAKIEAKMALVEDYFASLPKSPKKAEENVVEHDYYTIDGIGSLHFKEYQGKYYSVIECRQIDLDDIKNWEECSKDVFDYLKEIYHRD